MAALAVLAATSAVVSYQAQFRLIMAYKHVKTIAELQASIPDVSALVFAALGIALALHGKRALRARALNVAAVATSVTMNVLAAGHGWKALAVWALAPVAYAVTSDTLIGVLRAHVIAQQKSQDGLADDQESTPLAAIGRAVLYLLRLVLAPVSTLRGARRAVLNATPVLQPPLKLRAVPWPSAQPEPGNAVAAKPVKAIESPKATRPTPRKATKAKPGGKQAGLIRLAVEQHGLAELPLDQVSKLATSLAPAAGIHPATARRVLLAHARSIQNGGAQ